MQRVSTHSVLYDESKLPTMDNVSTASQSPHDTTHTQNYTGKLNRVDLANHFVHVVRNEHRTQVFGMEFKESDL